MDELQREGEGVHIFISGTNEKRKLRLLPGFSSTLSFLVGQYVQSVFKVKRISTRRRMANMSNSEAVLKNTRL